MQQLNPAIAAALREMMTSAARGDTDKARKLGEASLQRFDGHGAIHALLGLIFCRGGDQEAGITHLRAALKANPHDPVIAINLATALIDTASFEEAAALCSEERAAADGSKRLWRLRGYALQQAQDYAAAAHAYSQVVQGAPEDFESWNNLGNALTGAGRTDEALAALHRAAELAPDAGPIHLNLAGALSDAGRLEDAAHVLRHYHDNVPADPVPLVELATVLRHLNRDAEALEILEKAAALPPNDAELRVQLGEERTAAWQFEAAEQAFRDALAIDRCHARAYVQLALLYEHMNRDAELPALLAEARAAAVDAGPAHFIEALVCRREKRFEEGLRLLESVPAELEPIRRVQLEGQFRDRLGDAEGAFAAFGEMNRLFALDPSNPVKRAAAHRAGLAHARDVVTPQWFAKWPRHDAAKSPRSPVFLVGFPRSGTTLLDTILMGHPDVQLLEERPPLQQIEDRIGGVDAIAPLSSADADALRADYFAAVGEYLELRPDALLIDKSPLHMTKLPLIHRLFPDARIILALRHPCDVVLSCYMTSFKLNDAMSNFLDLENSAAFYDQCFSYWEQCRTLLPVMVHSVAYERLIADRPSELRPLFEFLQLPWNEEALDHRRTAANRGLITTASYAQVTEPIYSRSAGRWRNYRAQLAPVMPTLTPWIDRLGYAP